MFNFLRNLFSPKGTPAQSVTSEMLQTLVDEAIEAPLERLSEIDIFATAYASFARLRLAFEKNNEDSGYAVRSVELLHAEARLKGAVYNSKASK